ncbi:hypothetical protein [Flavobacterium dankookense]|uniref:Lipoprotein n=1 Tax=Flavobacterium dankookense TaxID=706186 RepID=A0A4V3CSE3_9FLAO|nr:hypothetical protein [Flavobacterium dankookense]TDP60292.1 hypothetical protein BC748_1274 [Flavobacterium dankookense]
MKKYLFLLLISAILFSCIKEEKDDSYEFLYNNFIESIRYNNIENKNFYFAGLQKYKSDSLELKNCEFHYNLTSNISKKLNNLDYTDRVKVFKFRDSVLKILNRNFKYYKEHDKLNLNDSVFKKMIQYKMSMVLNEYLSFHIFKPTALRVAEDEENK